MKIKIEKIKLPWYAPREDYDEEYLKELSESIENLGLLDDIIVRRDINGDYELIAGGQRVLAVKILGWEEITAKVLDVTEEEAAVLALESNVVRRNLKQIEEGKAIKKMMSKFKLTQKQVAERLRKSPTWVSQRLSLALDIADDVKRALTEGKISVAQAVIISQINLKREQGKQKEFLKLLLKTEKDIDRRLTPDETRLELKRFRNDTIYTIGFSGWGIEDFINILKENKIKVLVDIRESGKSVHKPEFSRAVLREKIQNAGLKFLERSEFGVPFVLREAGAEGFPWDCLEKWYNWRVAKKDNENIMMKLTKELKDLGESVLMCSERYPVPKGTQKHGCHRDILARLMLSTKIFTKREDF